MGLEFPKAMPGARGPFPPFRVECEILNLEWTGVVPAALHGHFFRCGPDRQFPPLCDDSWPAANADGMMSLFDISADRVNFRMRYVQTDRLKAEREAGRALFGAYRNPYTDDPSVNGVDRTVANTAVIWHGGQLFACKEDGLPYLLDPLTLETIGRQTFDGQWPFLTMTAHPRFDPVSGSMLVYGGQVDALCSSKMAIGEIDAAGHLVSTREFDAPYAGMVHDFAFTPNHIIILFVPVTTDAQRVRAGGAFWIWEPELPSHIAVIPRNDISGAIRWFTGPALWSWHNMNAFERDGFVHLDTTVAAHNAIFPNSAGYIAPPAPFFPSRLSCDMSEGVSQFTITQLAAVPSDFYSCDPRFSGMPYRHGFMAAIDKDAPLAPGFNAVAMIDPEAGTVRYWHGGEGVSFQEPLFIPRFEDAVEGDGYILVVANNRPAGRSELHIYDVALAGEEPVAVARLPFLIPMALHGTFVAAAELSAVYPT